MRLPFGGAETWHISAFLGSPGELNHLRSPGRRSPGTSHCFPNTRRPSPEGSQPMRSLRRPSPTISHRFLIPGRPPKNYFALFSRCAATVAASCVSFSDHQPRPRTTMRTVLSSSGDGRRAFRIAFGLSGDGRRAHTAGSSPPSGGMPRAAGLVCYSDGNLFSGIVNGMDITILLH